MDKYFKSIPTNDVEIRINAKSAGDYGIFRIGGVERTPNEEYRVCEEIVSEIRRHVDNVGWINIIQKQVYENNGEQFDNLYDALEFLFDESGCKPFYTIRYERPSDNGIGTQCTLNDFKEVITEAYQNPWKFEVQPGSVPLTEDQQKFLNRVIEASLNKNSVKEVTGWTIQE